MLTTTQLKPSSADVLPTTLLRSSVDIFAPVIAHIANLSFTQCGFPAAFKTAQVLPLLKKPGMDKEQMSSYRCKGHHGYKTAEITLLCHKVLFLYTVSITSVQKGHSTL